MARSGLSVAVVLLAAASAPAKLELQNIQASYGILGPERKSLDAHPGDEMVFRFTISGAHLDADGKTDAQMAMKLTNSNGDVLLAQDVPLRIQLGLGGSSFPAQARINLGERTPPDDYTLTVTVVDKQSLEKASFQRKITCKPTEFALLAPEFSYDLDGRLPAPAGGIVGQVLHFRLRGVGLDRSQEKIDAVMNVQVLDAQGKEQLAKPMTTEVKNDDADIVRKAFAITFRGQVLLNRAGEFTLRVTATDRIGKKTTKMDLPLRVTAPGTP